MENYYRVGQAAEVLGATARHVRVLCQHGLIPGLQTTQSGHYRIPESAIDQMAKDGVPPIPASTDHERTSADTPISPPRPSLRSGLFAEPSEKVIEAQEDLVIAERQVKKRSLDLQLEEIEDRFREREAKVQQEEAERQEAEEARRAAAKHQVWVDVWTQVGVTQLPRCYPAEERAELIEKLRSKLRSCEVGQSDVLTSQLILGIVAGFTRPRARRKEIEGIAERTIPRELRFDPDLKQCAFEAAWEAIRRLASDSSDRMIEAAVERACKPLLLQHQYKENCTHLLDSLWRELRGASHAEIEAAKDAVQEAFSMTQAGTPMRKLEQLRDQALGSTKNAIRSRDDQDARKRLLNDTFALWQVPRAEIEKAVREARDAFAQLPTGTAEHTLRQTRDVVFDRYKRKQALIESAVGSTLRDYIRKLESDWELDKSTWKQQSELSEAVRLELTEQIDGTEVQEQINRLMRQIVREELGVR